jgi:hypothetical protein
MMQECLKMSFPSRKAAIAALLTEPTLSAAAEAAGCSSKTLQRWLATPEFMAELHVAEETMMTLALARLAGTLAAAVETISDLLKADVAAPVRLRAAELALTLVSKWLVDEALADRLTVLEAAVDDKAD